MAFQTGTSTGPADLISKLATFAAANGWTVSPATNGSVFINAARDLYFGVAAGTFTIFVKGATGYSAGATWDNQPGGSPDALSPTQVNDCGGPHKLYYFFGTEQYLHVVIEVVTNKFKHFVFGQLEKNSTYTGGAYFDGSFHDMTGGINTNFPDASPHRYLFDTFGNGATGGTGRIRVDIDGKTNNWMNYGSSGAFSTESNMVKGATRTQYSLMAALQIASPNSFNQRTVLTPILIAAARGSGLFSLIGAPKDLRLVNMRDFNPGQIMTIGSDEWYVFPQTQKTLVFNTNSSTLPSSGLYGYAYKKVV